MAQLNQQTIGSMEIDDNTELGYGCLLVAEDGPNANTDRALPMRDKIDMDFGVPSGLPLFQLIAAKTHNLKL
jgi:hypothetical protein